MPYDPDSMDSKKFAKQWEKYSKLEISIRVSRIPFRTSSRHAFLINRLFKHHLMQFKKKNWKLIFKKQCKRVKTIFQPAQGSKWASLADHFQDFTHPKRQMPSNSHMFEKHYRIVI